MLLPVNNIDEKCDTVPNNGNSMHITVIFYCTVLL